LTRSSRYPGFHRLGLAERRAELGRLAGLSVADLEKLEAPLSLATADRMVENVVGLGALPLGVALNFVVNGREVLVPMCIEEPSVIAAASHAARLVREGGGFSAESEAPVMIAQIEVRGVPDAGGARARLEGAREELLAAADAAHARLKERGGGAVGLEVRVLAPDRLAVHIHLDCRDAMGANLCNTAAEALGPRVAEIAGGVPGLRILSNLADRRRVRVRAAVPGTALVRDGLSGDEVARAVEEASRFAELDPYRAATHNKGIMNGVDAVALATGQDWRALEAGAHAYAARSGVYAPLSRWRAEPGMLRGEMEIPVPVGVVGGALRLHGGARLALQIVGAESATALGEVIAAAGLATNLAALRALGTEGIQRGHMALHRRCPGSGSV
jgi:hydroxymethylglutaryl-CoA reductase